MLQPDVDGSRYIDKCNADEVLYFLQGRISRLKSNLREAGRYRLAVIGLLILLFILMVNPSFQLTVFGSADRSASAYVILMALAIAIFLAAIALEIEARAQISELIALEELNDHVRRFMGRMK